MLHHRRLGYTMMMHVKIDTTETCEDILRKKRTDNEKLAILRSQSRIIDRMLGRRLELVEAYAEIHARLHDRTYGIESMLDIIVRVAAHWSPEQIAAARRARDRLDRVNGEIADLATDLAVLLEERAGIGETSGFASETHFHIVDVIDAASSDNGLYRWHLKEGLKSLSERYDFKYWPPLERLARVIAEDARCAVTGATNPLTKAATTGSRGSRADFFKALFKSIQEDGRGVPAPLPRNFRLSDSALASLANCALDLGPDDPVDAAYVKRLRQRERERPA